MSLAYHPSKAMLTAYEAGSLGEALSLAMASHLSLCACCRASASAIDVVGGALLDGLPPMEMESDALAHALALIETKPREIPAPVPLGAMPAGINAPLPLQPYIAGRHWRRLLPGIALMTLMPRSREGGGAYLVRVAPGKALAHHGHDGRELTVVLSGSYHDELGRFGPGDLSEADAAVDHRPIADRGMPCICLISTEAPMRFSGLIARTLQPLFGV